VYRTAIRRSLFVLLAGLGLVFWLNGADGVGQTKSVMQLTVDGPIGPAVSDYVGRGLAKAGEQGAQAVILQMDTPGGLDTSMREIIQDILSSRVPVIGYVAPGGARAASAGTYILYACHVAAMAPATNLGAATPVQIGGGSPFSPPSNDEEGDKPKKDKTQKAKPDAESGEEADAQEAADADAPKDEPESAKDHPGLPEKAINDAIAYIRGLAQKRGRNAEWAEKAVREAASLSAEDALAEGVIDLIAESPDDLLAKVDGRTVEIDGQARTLATASLEIVELEADWRTKLLGVITNPTVAYLLLTLGVQALILEFYTGSIVAGVFGGICILLGLYGLHVLPVDYAGLALILLGLALLVAEAFVPSFGVLGIGGLVAFVAGSVMLLDTDVPGYGIPWYLVGSIATVAAGLMLVTMTMLVRSRRRTVVSGVEQMLDSTGSVIEWADGQGRVRVQGEVWQARAAKPMDQGARVRVRAIEGLTLVVEPEAEGS
jgi:membrane-bound serine protease (ClpP class)